jgi:hypothetical protein
MSNEVIRRSKLTKALFDHLSANVLIGRGGAPRDGGWSNGQPGSGTFTPYVVLKTGRASTPATGQPERLGPSRTSWVVGYVLTYHNTMESNVDDYADVARDFLVSFPELVRVDEVDWRVQRLSIDAMGETRQDNSTAPSHWSVSDDVSLHLSRVRAQ